MGAVNDAAGFGADDVNASAVIAAGGGPSFHARD